MSTKLMNFAKFAKKGTQVGATAIEYALIVVVIALVMYIGAKTLGGSLNTIFGTTVNGAVTSAGK